MSPVVARRHSRQAHGLSVAALRRERHARRFAVVTSELEAVPLVARATAIRRAKAATSSHEMAHLVGLNIDAAQAVDTAARIPFSIRTLRCLARLLNVGLWA